MASGNPLLNDSATRRLSGARTGSDVMTVEGTTNRALLLTALLVISAGVTWNQVGQGTPAMGLALAGAIVGFILAITTSFKPMWAPYTSVPYAMAEGLFLGGFSVLMERQFPGMILQAVALTMGTMFAFLAAYRTGLIKVTARLRSVIMSATMGIMLFYLASIVLQMFKVPLPTFGGGGMIGIGISLLVCGVAAFNLLLDFDFIENGARQGLPKAFEWYGAFALLVTLVWLYIEMVRLLSRLRER
ncbi:MAG: Bax inhibitor-1/YccA family protein [Candidatus Sericytochromatia bacterium]|nr:Bax inhibitor-1/YccA family protein [Candidatus Sericytochromatia bacterium]